MPDPDGEASRSQPTRRIGRAPVEGAPAPGTATVRTAEQDGEVTVPRTRGLRRTAAGVPAPPHEARGTRADAGVFYGEAFAMVDTVEVCFRRGDGAANLRAAAAWLAQRPGWHLRTLWYEHHGAAEIAQYDGGPRGALWLIAEPGSDEESAEAAAADGSR